MQRIPAIIVFLLFSIAISAQTTKLKSKKYPSLMWEITGKGVSKPSYLFGTMHVSNKMVFHLSDSFYLAIKNADVVAVETNPGYYSSYRQRGNFSEPRDFLSINTLKAFPYEKLLGPALSSNPSMINSFLYRNNTNGGADFEEDTYLDLYIYQVGKKWGKKLCGVEDFDESMTLMREAYSDAANDKKAERRNYDVDAEFSYAKMEEAYRTGNLDLLDTINKANSRSEAFDEKFLYRRNEIQANSIDSIIKSKSSLFVGVGAAHLPGDRGVIEMLRSKGFKLRPIKMTERDSRHKDEIEALRVPVTFNTQVADDGMFTVSAPGKLYSFSQGFGLMDQQQYADMSNGSYYMVARITTNAGVWGHNAATVQKKIDSILYEN
ncbi:MAG: TraB/GumN family protein, partial [Bacteroidota bacterium]